MIGKIVKVTVDRPMGSYHPNHRDIYYPVNYGYIKGIMSPDGEEQDAYILGVDHPADEFTGRVIAVIHRYDHIIIGSLRFSPYMHRHMYGRKRIYGRCD